MIIGKRSLLTTTVLLLAVACCAQNDALIHPAFVKLPVHFTEAWNAGEQDAARKRDMNSFLNKFRRGIGNISTAFGSQTVSFAWYIPPEYTAYYYGYEGKRLYKSEQEVNTSRQQSIPRTHLILDTVRFNGVITLWPSFGFYGLITRYPDPNDLRDVRVVLKVGEKILQPVRQPGNLLQRQGQGVFNAFIPHFQTNTSSTSGYYSGNQMTYFSGVYRGSSFSGTSNSTSSGYFYSSTTNTSYYVERIEQGFTWYQGFFSVEFKIFDDQGNPLITEKDKEMTLVVMYGGNERHAKFKLSDLINPLDSRNVRRSEEELRCISHLHLASRLVLMQNNAAKAREVLNRVEKIAMKYDSTRYMFIMTNYASLLVSNEKEAFAYASKILDSEGRDNPALLTIIAWIPLSGVFAIQEPNYPLILQAARRACELTKYGDSFALSTLSVALYRNGEIEEALQYQEKAIHLARQQGLPESFITNMEKFYREMKTGIRETGATKNQL